MTNFFKQLSELMSEGSTVNISTTKTADGLRVSVLVKNKDVSDPAAQKIQPLICNGRAEELDEGFFPALSQPIKQSVELVTNMKSYEDSVKTAEANSKAKKDLESKKKKEIEKNDKKFDEHKKKFDEFMGNRDFENAEKYLITAKGIDPISSKKAKELDKMNEQYEKEAPKQVSMFDVPGVVQEEIQDATPEMMENARPKEPTQVKSNNAQTMRFDEEKIEALESDYYAKLQQERVNFEQSEDLQYIKPIE